MEEKQKYPLEQLAQIKQRRLEEAEKVLEEKKGVLAKEQEKLATLEKERDLVKEHRKSKLTQLREKMDEGAPATKITQMKQYLKVVDERLKIEERKVTEQKKVVENAEKQVEIARQDLFKKQKDIEKIKMHRKEWDEEMREVMEHKEGIETDEMGGSIHIRRKHKKDKKR
jgi:flagellar biosynthesis chaperone FliJ